MRLNPKQARRERRAQELIDLEEFRTVRRVVHEELRELESAAPASAEVKAARTALEAATTADEVVALEPMVRTAGSRAGVDLAVDRQVRIAERWVSWADVGASYAGVLAAFRTSRSATTAEQRDTSLSSAKRRNPNPFEINASGG